MFKSKAAKVKTVWRVDNIELSALADWLTTHGAAGWYIHPASAPISPTMFCVLSCKKMYPAKKGAASEPPVAVPTPAPATPKGSKKGA